MADAARSPGRLEVFQTLREGLTLLPRAIGPFLLAYLVALGLMFILALVFVFPLQTLSTVLEVGGLGASGPGAKVAQNSTAMSDSSEYGLIIARFLQPDLN